MSSDQTVAPDTGIAETRAQMTWPWQAVRTGALALAIALPAFFAFNFIFRFGVDVPYWDEWELIPLFERWRDGQVTFRELFAQHNEHRLFFPRLVMLTLGRVSHNNSVALMYSTWACLVLILGLLLRDHLRNVGRSTHALLLFVPLPFLLFSVRQIENLLWGWQIQIAMMVAAFVAAMYLLFATERRPVHIVGAVVAATICTFSFASGLLVWPVGGLVLGAIALQARELRSKLRLPLISWGASGALNVVMYLTEYKGPPGHPSTTDFLKRPLVALHYLSLNWGSLASTEVRSAAGLGALLLIVVCAFAVQAWRERTRVDQLAFPAALLLFGLCNSAMLVVGRAGFGPAQGLASRYTTITVLGIVGLYRAVLALRSSHAKSVLVGALLAFTCVASVSAYDGMLEEGTALRTQRKQARLILQDYKNRSDQELTALYPLPAVVRERAALLERLQLSVFRP